MRADPGTIIHGKYEILAPLGEGGMGSVYRARHVLTEQQVALKVLRVGPGDESLAHRFKLEVSIAAKVKHPGIVKVFDAGTEPDRGRFYLAMELLEGRSLSDALEEEPPDVRAIVEQIAAAADAMGAAHAHGVVHRDLKPDNLFLERTEDGERLRVLDFGIARDLTGPSVTTTGVAVGTALYMAPEQGTAAKDIGPDVDIWALGVMLYEALAGRVPFDGASAHAVVIEAVTMPHISLRDLRPDLDRAWAELVDSCLSKKPPDRPNAVELHGALTTLLADTDTLAAAPKRDAGAQTGPISPQVGNEAFAKTADAFEPAPSGPRPLALDEEPPPVPTRSPLIYAAAAIAAIAALGGGLYALSVASTEDAPVAPVAPQPIVEGPREVAPAETSSPVVPTDTAPEARPADRAVDRGSPPPPRTRIAEPSAVDPAPREQPIGPSPSPELGRSRPERPQPERAEATTAPEPPAQSPTPPRPAAAADRPTPVETEEEEEEERGVMMGTDEFDQQARSRRRGR